MQQIGLPYKLKDPNQQVPQCYKKYTQQKQLFIAFNWSSDNLGKLCQMLSQWRLIKLLLSWNEEAKILKQICHIDFPALQVMCITNSLIESVQPLCNIYAPVLTYISLDSNNITCVKNLIKCYFPSLETISLNGNKIIETCYSNQIYAPHLRAISIEVSQEIGQPDQCVSWVAKLQNNNFKSLTIAYRKRILVASTNKTLRKKYGQESLWDCQLDLWSYYET